ncbi:MAG: helix-turn-helix transcriptional regulator [Actinobacteria bacterium]|nr:helix-turn-helix transcriptional regulator [Actinomycetota bacterium]
MDRAEDNIRSSKYRVIGYISFSLLMSSSGILANLFFMEVLKNSNGFNLGLLLAILVVSVLAAAFLPILKSNKFLLASSVVALTVVCDLCIGESDALHVYSLAVLIITIVLILVSGFLPFLNVEYGVIPLSISLICAACLCVFAQVLEENTQKICLVAFVCIALVGINFIIFHFYHTHKNVLESQFNLTRKQIVGCFVTGFGSGVLVYMSIVYFDVLVEPFIVVSFCAIALLMLFINKIDSLNETNFWRIYFVLIALLVLLFPVLPLPWKFVCWCILIAVIFSGEAYKVTLIFGDFRLSIRMYLLGQGILCLGIFVGWVLSTIVVMLGHGSADMLIVLCFAVSTIFMIAEFYILGSVSSDKKSVDLIDASGEVAPPAEPNKKSLAQRCELVVKEYEITKREAEIMLLLAKGRNAQYIGEKLFISSHTVKAHTNNIYKKMNVHTQQELIDLIDS